MCVCVCVCVLNGAIPAQAAMASAVASLSSPPAMGVKRSMVNGVWGGGGVCVCVFVHELGLTLIC